MTMTNEIDLSSIFDLSLENDLEFSELAPQQIGTFVTTEFPRAAEIGTFVTTSRSTSQGEQVRGSFVGGLVPASAVAGYFVSR